MKWSEAERVAFMEIGKRIHSEPTATDQEQVLVKVLEHWLRKAWTARQIMGLSDFVERVLCPLEDDLYRWAENEPRNHEAEFEPPFSIDDIEDQARRLTRIRKEYFAEMLLVANPATKSPLDILAQSEANKSGVAA